MKRMQSIFLAVVFLCLALPTGAEEVSVTWTDGKNEVSNSLGEHFGFRVEDGQAVLTGYWVERDKHQPAVISVPAAAGGDPLTAIGPGAFDNYDSREFPDGLYPAYDGKAVECIVIPEGVTRLDEGAFICAHFVGRIELPSTLDTIETGDTFHHVTAEIVFPNGSPCYRTDNGFLTDSRTESLLYCDPDAWEEPLPRVKRIETEALDNYSDQQTSLEFPDSVEYIGSFNAYDCPDLERITVPGSVTELADSAFECNAASEIILHEGLRRIGSRAFADTEVEAITIPATVTWIGFEPFGWTELDELDFVLLNPDCVFETEEQYHTREWTEATRDAEVLDTSDAWPLRKAEIIREKEEDRRFLRITMRDGSGLMSLSTLLPPFTVLDEVHAGDTTVLLSYPVGIPADAGWEDVDVAEAFFLTFGYLDGTWRLTSATNGWDWQAEVRDGVWLFNDFYAPADAWEWETAGEDRLTEFIFSDLEKMVAAYNEVRPGRDSLQAWFEAE